MTDFELAGAIPEQVRDTSVLPRLDGPAIGRAVRHRTFWVECSGRVVAETDEELLIRRGVWPFYSRRWVPRLCTMEVRTHD